ncbi:uncharacterized protein LOC142565972 [Dermacentor variabilis]|uniref:uncharacterized protein LOC142565972 n=1 Tax=Dermacentor variabilis TaxID=34621 RepID=UPI003F5BAB41
MTWLVGMRRGSQSENASPALCTTAKRATGRKHVFSIHSPKRLFAAGILLDKVDFSMARRMAEQQADTTGCQICLVEQGFTGRGDTSFCKAATMLLNIQGNIGLLGTLHDRADGEHGHHNFADDIFLQPQLSSLSSSLFEDPVQCGRLAQETSAEKKLLERVRHPCSNRRPSCCCVQPSKPCLRDQRLP